VTGRGRGTRPGRRGAPAPATAAAAATSTPTSTSTSTPTSTSTSTEGARARAVALRYLAAAARTEAQVRARLARDGLEAEADETVRWLAGLGYLDDAAWARARARALLGPARAGPRLAERRLVQAGVDPERARASVADAIAEATDARGSEGEAALCRALAVRRARTEDLDALDPRARARLARFLLGRGFAGSVVARIVGLWEDG
jgi:regulatory protein